MPGYRLKMMHLNSLREQVQGWARQVGKLQKEQLGRHGLLVSSKSTEVDLVTEIDRRSEDILLQKIHENYPSHGILSEESGEERIDADYLWIIDPLDGTTNYAQGLPIFAISIALQYKKEIILGVIYAPVLDEMYTAIKGEGAFLNGQPIRVSEKSQLNQSVLATGFPYDRAIHPDNNANYFSYFVPLVRGLRRMGAAAYDLACVAGGTLDGFWELNLELWDVAAGSLLVQEAGGEIIDLPHKRGVSLIAGNPTLSHMIFEALQTVDAEA